MAEGRQRDMWLHTTKMYLLLANVYRDEKERRRPYEFEDVYPFRLPKREKPKPPEVPVSALKVFVRKK